MEIKIKDGVSWQTEPGAAQSDDTMAWLRGEIYPQLAMNASETERVIPTTDKWGRPTEWVVEGDGWRVRIRREYMEAKQPTWSRRRDVVTVEEKGGES